MGDCLWWQKTQGSAHWDVRSGKEEGGWKGAYVVVDVEDVKVRGGEGDGALDFAGGDVVAAFGDGAGRLELVCEVRLGEVGEEPRLEVVEVVLEEGLVDFGAWVAGQDGGDGRGGQRGSERVDETHRENGSEWLGWKERDDVKERKC